MTGRTCTRTARMRGKINATSGTTAGTSIAIARACKAGPKTQAPDTVWGFLWFRMSCDHNETPALSGSPQQLLIPLTRNTSWPAFLRQETVNHRSFFSGALPGPLVLARRSDGLRYSLLHQ